MKKKKKFFQSQSYGNGIFNSETPSKLKGQCDNNDEQTQK